MLKNFPKDEEVIAQNAFKSFEVVAKSKAGGSSRHSSSKRSANSSVRSSNSTSRRRRRKNARAKDETQSAHAQSKGSETMPSASVENSSQEENSDEEDTAGNKIEKLKDKRKRDRLNLLLDAAFLGDVTKVKTILASGDISILDHDQNKRTALHVAASEGHHELVHLLLELRADANAKDKFENTPVNDAVRTKHDKVIDVIRSHTKSIKYSLPGSQVGVELCEAAATGNLEQITRLLNNGVNVNEADYDGRTVSQI